MPASVHRTLVATHRKYYNSLHSSLEGAVQAVLLCRDLFAPMHKGSSYGKVATEGLSLTHGDIPRLLCFRSGILLPICTYCSPYMYSQYIRSTPLAIRHMF